MTASESGVILLYSLHWTRFWVPKNQNFCNNSAKKTRPNRTKFGKHARVRRWATTFRKFSARSVGHRLTFWDTVWNCRIGKMIVYLISELWIFNGPKSWSLVIKIYDKCTQSLVVGFKCKCDFFIVFWPKLLLPAAIGTRRLTITERPRDPSFHSVFIANSIKVTQDHSKWHPWVAYYTACISPNMYSS